MSDNNTLSNLQSSSASRTTFSIPQFQTEVDRVIKNEAYCFDTEKFSEELVDATIADALKLIAHPQKYLPKDETDTSSIEESIPAVDEDEVQDNYSVYPTEDYESDFTSTMLSLHEDGKNLFRWPKISEFKINLGIEKIEKFIRTWERYQNWLYHIEFLGFESEDCSNHFVYEVEWSLPTNEYPIPQAVANVYFSLEVSKMAPHDREINVSYIFETFNVIHVPGKIDFQEKWLNDIIETKLKFYRSLTF